MPVEKIYMLWPCYRLNVCGFVKNIFDLDVKVGDAWPGIFLLSEEWNEEAGQPTAVIAIRDGDLSLKDEKKGKSSVHKTQGTSIVQINIEDFV